MRQVGLNLASGIFNDIEARFSTRSALKCDPMGGYVAAPTKFETS